MTFGEDLDDDNDDLAFDFGEDLDEPESTFETKRKEMIKFKDERPRKGEYYVITFLDTKENKWFEFYGTNKQADAYAAARWLTSPIFKHIKILHVAVDGRKKVVYDRDKESKNL